MKVLILTNLFGRPWDATRGVFNQQQFDRLARQVELKVLVAVPWTEAIRRPLAYWSARREGRQRWPCVDYFVLWYLPGFVQAMQAFFYVLSLLIQRPMDVLFGRWDVILGSWGFPDAVAAAAIGAMTSTPVLMKVHGTDVNAYLQQPGKRWQILAAARHCRAVMAPSQALRQRLIDAGIEAGQVSVNCNGVDTRLFQPQDADAARARLGVAADAQVLLFVGNLKPSKGCLDLLDAFIQIASTRPQLMLVFVGDGVARQSLIQRAADARLTGRVRTLGKLDLALLPDWYAASRLLCLPSHSEGLPNVVLEAMACGRPVVATRVGGVAEVLPAFAGILVPPHDTAALVAALLQALTVEWNVQRIAEHARSFTWEANVDRLLTLLRASARRDASQPGRP